MVNIISGIAELLQSISVVDVSIEELIDEIIISYYDDRLEQAL